MFPQQPQQQFRTAGADVQIFYGSGDVSTGAASQHSWSKPRGVSHIYMLLIGAGGAGDGTTSGGSGAVTVWYGAAQHVPDNLVLVVPLNRNQNTSVSARFSNSTLTPTALLTAGSGATPTAGAAMAANQFTASGFFQSVAGQVGDQNSVSATTFLMGGNGSTNVVGPYGYSTNAAGFFQLQPIIFGMSSTGANPIKASGIGCGGNYAGTSNGGQGMVLIASW